MSLPTWDKMSELDRGAALLHLWKRDWEGASYAVSDYPCEYFDDLQLTGLDRKAACRHAVDVIGSYDNAVDLLGDGEVQRLYDLALDADRARARTRIHARDGAL